MFVEDNLFTFKHHANIKLISISKTLLFYQFILYYKRLIPQGTVDNNLGPDRLSGP